MERAGLRKTLWELLVELAFDGVGSFAFAVGMQMFICLLYTSDAADE